MLGLSLDSRRKDGDLRGVPVIRHGCPSPTSPFTLRLELPSRRSGPRDSERQGRRRGPHTKHTDTSLVVEPVSGPGHQSVRVGSSRRPTPGVSVSRRSSLGSVSSGPPPPSFSAPPLFPVKTSRGLREPRGVPRNHRLVQVPTKKTT